MLTSVHSEQAKYGDVECIYLDVSAQAPQLQGPSDHAVQTTMGNRAHFASSAGKHGIKRVAPRTPG